MTKYNTHMAIKRQIRSLIKGFTLETTPFSADKISDFRKILRPETSVYITFLPGTDYKDTIRTAKRLKKECFNPIPHFAARSIPNFEMLENSLNRLCGEVGIEEVLCIAGAISKPIGDFANTMELLETDLFTKYGIKKIGVAGHPEGSPDIAEKDITYALDWKNRFQSTTDAQLYIVSQFCFDTDKIIQWDQKIRKTGNTLPIVIGVPGVASLKTLIAYANACGVGQSINFLKNQARNIPKLLQTSTPDEQILKLAEYRATDPSCGIEGIHIYPLGGLSKSAQWAYEVMDGHFKLGENGKGFNLDVKLS